MCNKAVVVARLTLTNRIGQQTVIEIHADAGFNKFYRWYSRPAGRKLKTFVRTSAQNDAPDLAALAARVKIQFDKLAIHHASYKNSQIVTTKLVVLKKKLYQKLLSTSPDQLPGGGPARVAASNPVLERVHQPGRRVPVQGYTPLATRWAILTGKV